MAPTVDEARAYRAVDLIDWPEGFHRIAWRALKVSAFKLLSADRGRGA